MGLINKLGRRIRSLYATILVNQVGGQTVEWMALGFLILGVLGAVVGGIHADDGTIGQKLMMALGRLVDKIAG